MRARLVEVAARLLATSRGPAAVTTRSVAQAAGVQAPTIYRLFGDKDGLLDAVAEHGFASYLAQKPPVDADDDPVEGLRAGWNLHVGFGLANPALFRLMHTGMRTPDGRAIVEAGSAVLHQRVLRVARAGRLRVTEHRAVELIRAAGTGVVFALINQPEEVRTTLSRTWPGKSVCATILTDPRAAEPTGPVAAAVTLRAALPELTPFTTARAGSPRRLAGSHHRCLTGPAVGGSGNPAAAASSGEKIPFQSGSDRSIGAGGRRGRAPCRWRPAAGRRPGGSSARSPAVTTSPGADVGDHVERAAEPQALLLGRGRADPAWCRAPARPARVSATSAASSAGSSENAESTPPSARSSVKCFSIRHGAERDGGDRARRCPACGRDSPTGSRTASRQHRDAAQVGVLAAAPGSDAVQLEQRRGRVQPALARGAHRLVDLAAAWPCRWR